MPDNNYTFVPDLLREFPLPETAMTSRVLHTDDRFNITLFGFAAGRELRTHSVPIPALIYVVEGEGEFDLGSETVQVKSGSFIRGSTPPACGESENSVSDAVGPGEGSRPPEIVPVALGYRNVGKHAFRPHGELGVPVIGSLSVAIEPRRSKVGDMPRHLGALFHRE